LVLALFRRLLLLPLLSPLLVALLLAALNPRPVVSLRLLIWRSPELPIGLWLGAGAGGGALLSASATALALRQGRTNQRRRGRGGRQDSAADASSEPWSESWEERAVRPGSASWFNRPAQERSPAAAQTPTHPDASRSNAGSAGPERPPGEPAPTVSVPFRVLHRPSARPADTHPGGQAHAKASAPFVAQAEPEMMAVDDDWAQNEGDDW
jgi:uncharacterized integral membrane protein